MYFTSRYSLLLTLPVAILAGGFLVRIFIIFHDCTHNSFFRSRRANEIWGFLTGVLCFTPFHHWKWEHTVHHAHSGDLDGRGLGDIWTLTVDEYLAASKFTRLRYRLNRNPIVLFLIAPTFLFIVLNRFTSPGASRRAVLSVHLTTVAILIFGCGLSAIFGWKIFLLIQFAVLFVASAAGVWLFYVQHQFEGVQWERSEDWNFAESALNGSSFYRLPRILQWFSGNIGFHHLHHLSPQIPNYHLENCHKTHPLFGAVPEITLRSSLKSFHFRLWDEEGRRLVGFDHLRKIKSGTLPPAAKELPI
jgi:omega-6 fatty acid desaturase (delta-12 desaturase)